MLNLDRSDRWLLKLIKIDGGSQGAWTGYSTYAVGLAIVIRDRLLNVLLQGRLLDWIQVSSVCFNLLHFTSGHELKTIKVAARLGFIASISM